MAEDNTFYPTGVFSLIGIVVSTIVPIILLRYFKTKETKENRKADEVKDVAERTALSLKEATERNAKDVLQYNEKLAADLEKAGTLRTEKIAEELKANTAQIALDLIKQNDTNNTQLVNQMNSLIKIVDDNTKRIEAINENIRHVDTKQIEMGKAIEIMINNLHTKADITNGNVEKIRTDVLNLQEDTDEVYDKLNNNKPSEANRRKRSRNRMARRNEISQDAKNQHYSVMGNSK